MPVGMLSSRKQTTDAGKDVEWGKKKPYHRFQEYALAQSLYRSVWKSLNSLKTDHCIVTVKPPLV